MRGLITLLILSFAVTVQDVYGQGVEIDIFARPALTSLRGNDIIKANFDPKISLSTGLGINYFLKDNSTLSVALLYDTKGGMGKSKVVLRDSQNQTIGAGTVTFKSTFEYITIPIRWGQRFGQKVQYQFGIGVYGSFLLNQETSSEGLDGFANANENNTAMYKKQDFGLSAGFGAFIPIEDAITLTVGLDDNLGLMNVSDRPVANDGTIKHNSLGLFVGLKFKVN